jgi:hypothetical protein
MGEPLDLLRAKFATVLRDRNEGRGDYDRLTEIIADLRQAIRSFDPHPTPPENR